MDEKIINFITENYRVKSVEDKGKVISVTLKNNYSIDLDKDNLFINYCDGEEALKAYLDSKLIVFYWLRRLGGKTDELLEYITNLLEERYTVLTTYTKDNQFYAVMKDGFQIEMNGDEVVEWLVGGASYLCDKFDQLILDHFKN